jgi:hypothetical protein
MSLTGGRPAVAAVYTDISRQKEIETALRDAKAHLASRRRCWPTSIATAGGCSTSSG